MYSRLAILTLAFASTAFATSIFVNNSSFETLPVGGLPIAGYAGGVYSIAPIPGWVNGGTSGQFQPGTVPNAYYNTLDLGPTEAYTNGGTISQTVGATVQVGVVYTLLVDLGARLDEGFASVADLLINGNRYVATGTPLLGGFATFTATYTGLVADAGDSITIELSDPTGTGQGNFDNVRLSNNLSSVPEPATWFTCLAGLAIGALRMWGRLAACGRLAIGLLSPPMPDSREIELP
jgi:hypothetical protein